MFLQPVSGIQLQKHEIQSSCQKDNSGIDGALFHQFLQQEALLHMVASMNVVYTPAHIEHS